MAEKESLHFKIGISGTYWDKRPQYSIAVGDNIIKEGAITVASDETEYIEFDYETDLDAPCLKISLLNKTDQDTVQNEDKTAIVNDMLLNIVSVEIDEINLGHLIYGLSEYHVAQSVEYNGEITNLVKNCVNLGWNGTWQLTWNNPFYIWLLENI